MAIFSKKTKAKKEAKAESFVSADKKVAVALSSTSHTLLHPRVTEKASEKAMNENVYVFEVGKDQTKKDVKKAVVQMYKVHPVKIAMVKIPAKNVFIRGRKGVRAGGKKAYVYLKKGDKIEIV